MKYKAIIFDLDNTLLDYSSSELKSMQRTVQEYGFFHNERFIWNNFWTLFSKINTNYWLNRNKSGYKINQVLEFSFRDTLLELGLDHSGSKRLADLYWNAFCNSSDLEENALHLLSQLHGDYKLAVISNGIGEAQRGRLAAGEMEHYFDTLVISDEVGYWKPDNEIFNVALKRLEINHTEALFVGDSLDADYYGALNADIDFCFYNREGNPIENHINPKYMINSLLDLRGCLDK